MAKLFAWGSNADGQLGLNDTSDRSSPTQVGSETDWKQISLYAFVVAVKSDGGLWSWGNNNHGQLGQGDTSSRSSPVQVGSDTNWSEVVVGKSHSLAVKSNGTLWAWGYNSSGQLGLNDTSDRSSPTQVGSETDWDHVAAGDSHSLAVKTDGTLWSWGSNGNGQLGGGSSRSSPVQVGSDTNWDTITAGYLQSFGIKSDGTLWAWGRNNIGQLGLGDTSDRGTPTQVGSDVNWSGVSTFYYHSILVKQNGTLWSCGFNSNGQLGLGDTSDRSSPTQVGSLTNWCQVAAGEYYSLAAKSDGTLWAWGNNNVGQLGLNDTSDRSSPTQVGSETDWDHVECGYSSTLALAISAPCIQSGTVASDNSYCKLVFSKLVYSDAGASQTINKDDLSLTFTQNGGDATAASITSLYKDAGLTTPLTSNAGYDTVYAKLDITGVPTGVETIEIKPASGSAIYDVSGNAMADTETTGALSLYNVPASIINGVMANDNAYVEIDFSEIVWADSGNTAELTPDSFLVDFHQNGGGISAVSINALFQDADLSTPLASGAGYSTVYAQLLATSGFPTGDETIEIKPKDGSSIFDSSGGAMDAAETTGLLYFHSVGSAVSLNWSTLDPVISALRSIISLFLVSLFGHGLHVFFTDKALFQEVENDLHTRISSLPTNNQALGIELLNFFQRYYGR